MADASTTQDNLLAQPLTLPNGSVLRNRIAKSAMSEALASYDNHVTPLLPALYRRWAQSGIGLLITGNVMIDRRALGEPGNVVLEDDADLPLLRQWAEAATAQGVQIWVQLNHPGKQSPKGLNDYNLSPSAIPFRKDMAAFFDTPRETTPEQIKDIIARFGRSAALAKQAGFSGVQIHGAHGYLVSQFLSPHHNQRGDQWGGSAENRRRFVLAVYAEIRRQVGPEFPVGIKLNSADFQKGGFSEEESLEVIRALAAAGIDLVEISGGTYESPAMTGVTRQKASTAAREAYFLEFARDLAATARMPLMVTGGIRRRAVVQQALDGGVAMAGIASALALAPDLPRRWQAGEDAAPALPPIRWKHKLLAARAYMASIKYQMRELSRGRATRPRVSPLRALLLERLDVTRRTREYRIWMGAAGWRGTEIFITKRRKA